MNKQLRHRLAIGFTALAMAAAMAVGAVSVAADGSDLDGANVVANETTLRITSVDTTPAIASYTPAATQNQPVAGSDGREDGQ